MAFNSSMPVDYSIFGAEEADDDESLDQPAAPPPNPSSEEPPLAAPGDYPEGFDMVANRDYGSIVAQPGGGGTVEQPYEGYDWTAGGPAPATPGSTGTFGPGAGSPDLMEDPGRVLPDQATAPAPDPRYFTDEYIDPYIKENVLGRAPEKMQSALQGIAAGQMSPVIQHQRDRAIQDALATAASARGMPTSAIQRMKTQQIAQAGRAATEAAAQQQLQAGQMVDQMRQAEATVNAQLEGQRDSMIEALVSRGVDRNLAVLQANSELKKLREELRYKEWAGLLGAQVEVLKPIMEETGTGEDIWEQVLEEGPVLNYLANYPRSFGTLSGMLTGDVGHSGPSVFGYGQSTGAGASSFDDTNHGYMSSTMGVPGGVGLGDWRWDSSTGRWITSGIEAKENLSRIGVKDEFFRQREATPFGQISEAPSELLGTVDPTNPMAAQNIPGDRMLGDVRRGLQKVDTVRDAVRNAPPLNARDEFRRGADFMSDAYRYGQVGALGTAALAGNSDERERAAKELALYGGREVGGYALGKGADYVGEHLDKLSESQKALTGAADKVAEETASIAGDASEQTLGTLGESQASAFNAASAAPYIGGTLQFLSDIAGGDQPLPAAIQAAGSGLGGAAGAWAASQLGQAAATGAASAAMGAGTGAAAGSWLPGIGTAIGAGLGAIGAGLGGAAVAPLAEAARDRPGKRYAPSEFVRDPGELVGAPSIRSGLETKQYVEGLTPYSKNISEGPPSYMDTRRDYLRSDERTKQGIDPSKDELSDFLRELNPVKYDYKPEYGGEKNQYGIIAQDAQKTPVGDSFVKQNGDGTHVIDTGKATMVNMAALANQQRILDRQGEMIAELLKGRS